MNSRSPLLDRLLFAGQLVYERRNNEESRCRLSLSARGWSLGIFILDCRDCDHLAVLMFAAQPTEKGAFEQLSVETVGLGAPVFTRYRYARCVDNVGLDAACPEPARQPETIPAGLEGNCNAFDLASCFLRFLTPAANTLGSLKPGDRHDG